MWFGDDEQAPPFPDVTLLNAGLQNQVVTAGVDALEDIFGGTHLAGLQVDELAARIAWVKRLVLVGAGDAVAARAAVPVHYEHEIAGIEIQEVAPAQVVMRQQPDVAVTRRQLEVSSHARDAGDVLGFALRLVDHAQVAVAAQVDAAHALKGCLGGSQLREESAQ